MRRAARALSHDGGVTKPLTAAERQRLRTTANLWRALIPLLLLVAFLVVFNWPRGNGSNGVRVVDTAGPISAARIEAGFALLAPVGLSDRWRATSVEFTPAAPNSGATFRIGYVTPKDSYAEFLEGDDAPDAVVAQYGPLSTEGAVSVDGVAWQHYTRDDNSELLRHTSGKVTVAVTGRASQDELVELAASLRP